MIRYYLKSSILPNTIFQGQKFGHDMAKLLDQKFWWWYIVGGCLLWRMDVSAECTSNRWQRRIYHPKVGLKSTKPHTFFICSLEKFCACLCKSTKCFFEAINVNLALLPLRVPSSSSLRKRTHHPTFDQQSRWKIAFSKSAFFVINAFRFEGFYDCSKNCNISNCVGFPTCTWKWI